MTTRAACPFLFAALLLAGCAGTPPPPDWKMNAVSQLEHFQARWLEGDGKSAELALAKARKDVSASGRLDLLARLELAACGTRAASLDFTDCPAYRPLAADAADAERRYAQFLGGQWRDLQAGTAPPQYAGLVTAKDDAAANRAAAEIKEPLPRLIAAALLFRQGRAEPATLALAVETASERGWRRPLLAWLEVQRLRATAAGDLTAAQLLQRRIEMVQNKGM
ncbi:MAG: hypothetical protein AB1831_09150 [Pseudomonadota bacterium]